MGFKNILFFLKKEEIVKYRCIYIYMYIQINNILNIFNVDYKYFLFESLFGKVKRVFVFLD